MHPAYLLVVCQFQMESKAGDYNGLIIQYASFRKEEPNFDEIQASESPENYL